MGRLTPAPAPLFGTNQWKKVSLKKLRRAQDKRRRAVFILSGSLLAPVVYRSRLEHNTQRHAKVILREPFEAAQKIIS